MLMLSIFSNISAFKYSLIQMDIKFRRDSISLVSLSRGLLQKYKLNQYFMTPI